VTQLLLHSVVAKETNPGSVGKRAGSLSGRNKSSFKIATSQISTTTVLKDAECGQLVFSIYTI
jgi:hypothetical protein